MRVSAHRTKIFFREDRKIYRNYYFCKKKEKKERERRRELPRKTTKILKLFRNIEEYLFYAIEMFYRTRELPIL